jgi:hypothetical protein
MTIWTLAYHNRTGTGAIVFTIENDAYLALIQTTVDPTDTRSLLIARKMMLLRQFEELCLWLQEHHFGTLDDYRIQSHEIEVTQ